MRAIQLILTDAADIIDPAPYQLFTGKEISREPSKKIV